MNVTNGWTKAGRAGRSAGMAVGLALACWSTGALALEEPVPDTNRLLLMSTGALAPEAAAKEVAPALLAVQPPAGQTPSKPSATSVIAQGLASWYGDIFQGRRTASGERYDMHEFTAAHKTLPFGTRVRVKSVRTGKEIVVRINDRGPFAHRRLIDLSRAAATALGVRGHGVTSVVLLRE